MEVKSGPHGKIWLKGFGLRCISFLPLSIEFVASLYINIGFLLLEWKFFVGLISMKLVLFIKINK